MKVVRLLVACLLMLAVSALVPAGAGAASFNFFNADSMGPSGGAGTEGPATTYPSSTLVSGLGGTLTKVTVTLLELESGSADDIDALLVGPEAQQVMLMSDACGQGALLADDYWTFDDDAPAGLPDSGPCASNQVASFKPTNHIGDAPEPEQFGAGGSIAPPYGTSLSVFDGTDPNGPWDLYVRDDGFGIVGFGMAGWLLTIEVTSVAAGPPAPAAGPPPAAAGPPPGANPQPPAAAKRTGKRARALAKCKDRKTSKVRKSCRAKARKLPR